MRPMLGPALNVPQMVRSVNMMGHTNGCRSGEDHQKSYLGVEVRSGDCGGHSVTLFILLHLLKHLYSEEKHVHHHYSLN